MIVSAKMIGPGQSVVALRPTTSPSAIKEPTMQSQSISLPRPKKTISKSKDACAPLFSDEDSDLAIYKWRANKDGHVFITTRVKNGQTKYSSIYAHRVVVARMVGRDPTRVDICDHIDGNKLDDRRCNLRLGDCKLNAQNHCLHNTNTSGHIGVYPKAGKWCAQVCSNYKNYHCGLFDSKDAAAAAAKQKRKELGFIDRQD